MRRDPNLAGDDVEVPAWLISEWGHVAAGRRLTEDPALLASTLRREPGRNPVWAETDRHRAEAERWCAERGLSFCRTVLGARWPSEPETLAGCTRGAGPKFAATVRWCRDHGRGDTPS